MKKLVLVSLFFTISAIAQTSDPDQKVPVFKIEKETIDIVNSLFSEMQKEENTNIDSRIVSDILVDQVVVNGKVAATILSDKGLRSKKGLSTFLQLAGLIKEMREIGNFQYPKIVNIFILKDIDGEDVILAIREGASIPPLVKKFL